MESTTGIDGIPTAENAEASAPMMNLGLYADGDMVTKRELCRPFSRSERTLQRMVERFEIPPPTTLAGRKVWIAGKVRAWIVEAANRKEAEAVREARRLKVFST